MNTLIYTLGLKEYEREGKPRKVSIEKQAPKAPKKPKSANQIRHENALSRYKEVMQDYLMTATEVSKYLGIGRPAAWEYLNKLEQEGKVERAGMTCIYGQQPTMLWRWKKR